MYIVTITGASGSILGIRLIEQLLLSGKDVASIVSDSAWKVLAHETGDTSQSMAYILKQQGIDTGRLKEYNNNDFSSPPSSGTSSFKAVIVAPCSMKTLSGIASGYADTLINRIVDVALKESRKCILIPRETPLNLIHIENMLRIKQAGAEILLPVPGFYTFPETIDDVIDFIIGKTLNLLGIKHQLFQSWGENS